MEWKIGEIRQVNGEWYQCIENWLGCEECDFKTTFKCIHEEVKCSFPVRQDHTSVIFKKLEKVGVPYHNSEKKLCQQYKCYINPLVTDEIVYVFADNRVVIEIKQNKEDMEEKKLNLKPFDLQKAREGKPVCTRDGRKARIICFDRDCDMHIVALVSDPLGESVHYYLSNGKVDFDKNNDYDLMMLPEKKEGWVNVYKGIDGVTLSQYPYTSKDEAIKESDILFGRIDTIKVSWEE